MVNDWINLRTNENEWMKEWFVFWPGMLPYPHKSFNSNVYHLKNKNIRSFLTLLPGIPLGPDDPLSPATPYNC